MATTDASADAATVASHTLAYLRSHGKKLDLVLETLARQGERLGRLEREVGEARRDMLEIKTDMLELKSDIVLLVENKLLTAQTEILTILHRLDQQAIPADSSEEPDPDAIR